MSPANDNPPRLTAAGLDALATEAKRLLRAKDLADPALWPDLCARLVDALAQVRAESDITPLDGAE